MQKAIERTQQVVVGVNKFRMEEEEAGMGGDSRTAPHANDPATEKRQIERVEQVRKARDARRVQAALAHLQDAAKGAENLMPAILEITRASATIGELTQVLRDVFGEFREPVTL